jgi:hypothetical protein
MPTEPSTQFGAKAAFNASGDHMGAPEEEPDIAAELQQDQGARHFRPITRAPP